MAMKQFSMLVLAVLAVQASGARTSRITAAPVKGVPQTVLCENTTARKAAAIGMAKEELHSLQENMRNVTRSVVNLTKDLTKLAAKIKTAEKGQASATSIRQKERAQFTAETQEVKALVDKLKKAMGALGTAAHAAHASFLQEGSGAHAAVKHVVEALASAPSVKPGQLSLLQAFASAREGAGPEPAAVRGVLGDMAETFHKHLESAEQEEDAKVQQFGAFVAEKQAALFELKSKMDQKEQATKESEAVLSSSTRNFAESEDQLKANKAMFEKIEAHCDTKQSLAGFRSHLRTEAKPEQQPPAIPAKAGAEEPFRKPDAKELERMKAAMGPVLTNFADTGVESPDPTQYGPYDMEAHVDIPITGFSGCSAPYLGNIYLPIARSGGATPPPAPVITFAHGFSQGAQLVDLNHRNDLFRPLVAMGFAVVAHQTGGLIDYCDSSFDQLHMLTWAASSSHAPRINFNKAVLMGFSMGGRATMKNAADPNVIAANHIFAVVGFMPHCSYGCGIPVAPTHFFTGTLDGVAPYQHTQKVYNAASADKLFALVNGAGHVPTPAQWTFPLTPHAATFLACKVFNNTQQCTKAFARYAGCQYGCKHCGCQACEPCLPCWGASPPAWCTAQCSACNKCKTCTACKTCTTSGTASFFVADKNTTGKAVAEDGAATEPHVNSTVAALPASAVESFRKPGAKELERMRELVNGSLTHFASAGSHRSPDPTQYGPYDMEATVDIPISGFSGCSAPFLGNIYLPIARPGGATPPPAPVITFAHGFSQGAQLVDLTHRNDLFRPLVAMGFAIVAQQTGGLIDYCDSSHDQLHMLTWAKGSTYASRIDFSQAVLMGFSMGGRATLKNAGDASVVAANNILSVVAFMPHCSYGCGIPKLPTIFFTGTLDGVAPAQHTKKVYSVTKKDKIYNLINGAGHVPTSAQWTFPMTPDAASFLGCKVYKKTQQCTKVFGKYESCWYGCQNCGCQACAPCLPCWGASPPSWCASKCSACNACKDCDKCSKCNGR